jgi:HAMP domain-containing protein
MRARTTAAATIIVAAALVTGGFLTFVVLRHTLVNNVDDAARRRAQDVAELAVQGSLPQVLSAAGEQATIVQVVDAKGEVVSSSANFAGPRPVLGRPAAGSQKVHTISNLPVKDEQGDDFRIATTVVQTQAGPVAVNAGESLESAYEGVTAVRRILVIGLPVMLVLVGLTTWYVVGRALRPVDDIRREVADISAHDLSRRVPQPTTDDEISRLAQTMNAMLDRLESFTDRQRRFVADASHELQSPLASSIGDGCRCRGRRTAHDQARAGPPLLRPGRRRRD